MRIRYITSLWIALVFIVVTIVTEIVLIYSFALFRYNTLLSTVSLAVIMLFMVVVLKKYFNNHLLRKLGVTGGLILPPALLFITSLPTALIYVMSGYRETTAGNHYLALITATGAFLYISAVIVFSVTAFRIINVGFNERLKSAFGTGKIILAILFFSAVTIILIIHFKSEGTNNVTGHVLLLPLLAAITFITSLILSLEFRRDIRYQISLKKSGSLSSDHEEITGEYTDFLRNSLLFRSHYLDIISGVHDYLLKEADDSYGLSLIRAALRDFDPALLPALKLIAATERFSETIRKEAEGAIANIEKYFADPVKNRDLVIQSGQSEKVANAHLILTEKRVPETNEIVRLLHDSNTDIRRVGLAAVGLFRINKLLEEIVQALTVPETEIEAFFLLKHLGPEIKKDLTEIYKKHTSNERLSSVVIRLIGPDFTSDTLDSLVQLFKTGSVSARLGIIQHLSESGYEPSPENKEILQDMAFNLIGNIAAIISLQASAKRNRYFLLEKSLGWDRDMNKRILFATMKLIVPKGAAELLREYSDREEIYSSRYSAEIIRTVSSKPLRAPLLALINNTSDEERLDYLSDFYPLKDTGASSLAQQVLSADWNISGVWSKSCALRKVSDGKLHAEKDTLITFLFSRRAVLQEEGAKALNSLYPGWYKDVYERLAPDVLQRIRPLIEGTLKDVALVFSKTRFLSLCFNQIPEERILFLASRMNYSQSHDARFLPGNLVWIVPAENDKSGIYLLSANVLTDFIFHYSEYTDIFVEYIGTFDRDSFSQIISS